MADQKSQTLDAIVMKLSSLLSSLLLLTLWPGTISTRAANAPLLGAKPWITILCRFADLTNSTPHPTNWYATLMTGANTNSMDRFFREASYDQINLNGSAVSGWHNLPGRVADYVLPGGEVDRERLLNDAIAVADSAVFFPNYYGINLMFNGPLPGACYGGPRERTIDGQTKTYGTTWMQFICHNHASLAHEMGHGFGLDHSSGPYFPDEPWQGPHTYDSYWDSMSYGGNCSPGDPQYACTGVHFNSYHKEVLGWIPAARKFLANPGTNAVVHLERLAQPGPSGHLMVKIPWPGWATRYYTVEARRVAGFDGNGLPGNAVVIHKVDTTRLDRQSQVIDGGVVPDGNENPNDAGAMWLPGESFVDAANGITVTITAQTATGFDLTVVVAPNSLRPDVVSSSADAGPATLREAIHWANASGGGSIRFNLPGANPSLAPLNPLPDLTAGHTILDGATQPGYAGQPLIEISGGGVGFAWAGLVIPSGSNMVRGFSFTGWPVDALWINGPRAVSNRIEGCYFGVLPDGVTTEPNERNGLALFEGASGNVIGGPAVAQRNVISGNANAGVYVGDPTTTGNRIENNFIGMDATGAETAGNGGEGIWFNGAVGNIIGGTTAALRNVISANAYRGIYLGFGSASNEVRGNFIGTDVTGQFTFGNGLEGVTLVDGARGNLIGGPDPMYRNVISGNIYSGIWIGDAGTAGNRVEGNFIGLDATGLNALGNGGEGVILVNGASSNVIGGSVLGARNVIAANFYRGVFLTDAGTRENVVKGNLLGTDATGTNALGNGYEGVALANGANSNRIGGPLTHDGNVISGNTYSGIWIGNEGTRFNTLLRNLVGVDVTGTNALSNGGDGLSLADGARDTLLGGAPGHGNVISANLGNGISWYGTGNSNNVLQGNWIGTDRTGMVPLGNARDGVAIFGGASRNDLGIDRHELGWPNVIAFNQFAGVAVFDANSTGNRIRGNSIFSNQYLDLNLVGGVEDGNFITANDTGDGDTGPNDLQNFPTVTARVSGGVTTISGTLSSAPNRTYLVDFYRSSGANALELSEGKFHQGSMVLTTRAGGTVGFAFGLSGAFGGQGFTATATEALSGSTSEFGPGTRAVAAAANSPVLTAWPSNRTVIAGTNVALVATATGAATLRYQWRWQGTNLPGATNATLALTNVQVAQTGDYSVIASNSFGLSASPNARLTVVPPPPTAPHFNAPLMLGAGGFSATLAGLQATTGYRVQVSSNLVAWSEVTNFVAAAATRPFLDPTATNTTQRFYRIVTP